MGADFDSRMAVALAVITLIILLLIWRFHRQSIKRRYPGGNAFSSPPGSVFRSPDDDSHPSTDGLSAVAHNNSLVDSAIENAARDVVANILVVCGCPPSVRSQFVSNDPLPLSIDALSDLLAQYNVVFLSNPRDAAYGLYHALSDNESGFFNMVPLVESIPPIDSWNAQAALAFSTLPRHVRLLGVHLELA